MSMSKSVLLGMTLEEITKSITELELPRFAAREIALWIYRRGATSYEHFSNLSKNARLILSEHFELGLVAPKKVSTSVDGTKKYLFKAKSNRYIESAYIPETKRNTLCLSSQIGCKLGCEFCMTARQGFQGHLSAGEIINQIVSIPEREIITNLVYMGMGEPFDNTETVLKSLEIITADYGLAVSPRKITVSTVGMIPGMKRFIEESKCQLAISMHSPFDEERLQFMPIEKVYPIRSVIEVLKGYTFEKQRRVSFEYIVFKGLNDTPKHVNQLARILNGLRCRINLIRYHEIPGSSLKGTDLKSLQEFRDRLDRKGITTTIRASRGEDILAACGMLSTKELSLQESQK
jgi:23S rRNA (adenine2503-C2)-methyltransferase